MNKKLILLLRLTQIQLIFNDYENEKDDYNEMVEGWYSINLTHESFGHAIQLIEKIEYILNCDNGIII